MRQLVEELPARQVTAVADEVTADAVTGGYRISGEKWMIDNATRGSVVTVPATARLGGPGTGLRIALKGLQLTRTLSSARSLGAGGHALGLAMSLACNRSLLANRTAHDDSALWRNGIWLHAVLARSLPEPSTMDADGAVITTLTRHYAEGRVVSLTAHRIATGIRVIVNGDRR